MVLCRPSIGNEGTRHFQVTSAIMEQSKIKPMRCARFIVGICLLASLAVLPCQAADDAPVSAPIISCGNGVPGGTSCAPSKKDFKEARHAYERGLKLEEGKSFQEAFAAFDEASRLVPDNMQFFGAREVAKSQLVFQHTERGDAMLSNAQREVATAEYRMALKLDPDNDYVQGRLTEALRYDDTAPSAGIPELLSNSYEIHLLPRP